MRLAAYNVENLFDRAKAMNLDSWAEGKPILTAFAKLNSLLGEISYSTADKRKMVELMIELGLEKSDKGPFVILRRNHGGLVKRPRTGGLEIIADGSADWVGSLELRDEPIDENAVRNTARVLADLEADVVGVIEAENRPALNEFNRIMIPAAGGTAFRHVMVIDGNDERGIDVGLLCREGFAIDVMRSHVDDRMANGVETFSRDCPEYHLTTPNGNRLVVMVNHFKSKGYGSLSSSEARRKAQAQRVKEIYEGLIQQGEQFIAVVGDLNDTPDSIPLAPLIGTTTLKDAFKHPSFDNGGYPGTYDSCSADKKIDYLLLSPKLFDKVIAGGVIRKGMWPGVRPKKWDVYDEIVEKRDGASDHAAIWVDVDL
ncbi:endonuclease/exonuclease/phosphatase family protein [Bradyrhizobium sediminis]|uniref:Endonuclease/exonuclease/phosphatase family protein n=1 Tax=Bradyrhizobium sediminis TaxID=2840469 RepID=A0A975RNX7_9BRAD|nr:endonuclease/exonuclease/phosphatase family protein [Bradyrhizobium sediminis]QWG15192.1 endonuclease/exonuclease/phosphatase family protein [Bradyrhizobium sediminis]